MPEVVDQAAEQRLIRCNVTWEQFKLLQKGFEGTPGIRLSYSSGIVEIFMPRRDHELFKKIIAILIEIFCIEKEIEFEPTGSMDQEIEKVSTQANES